MGIILHKLKTIQFPPTKISVAHVSCLKTPVYATYFHRAIERHVLNRFTVYPARGCVFRGGGGGGGGGGGALRTGYRRVDGFSLIVPTQKLKVPWKGLAGHWKHINSRDL